MKRSPVLSRMRILFVMEVDEGCFWGGGRGDGGEVGGLGEGEGEGVEEVVFELGDWSSENSSCCGERGFFESGLFVLSPIGLELSSDGFGSTGFFD